MQKAQNDFSNSINTLRFCVIIPTYNNARTLRAIIEGTLAFTSHIIIVNDGSSEDTKEIIESYPELEQIHFSKNKGKGVALRKGFERATALGYHFAITIDSDGQHFPSDLPVFLNALAASENKDVLLIGARNMSQEGVPKKSSFGNKFSNFWFWVETGIRLEDTQSGFRLYPLWAMRDLTFFTSKFEFEIEVIVKAAWKGIEVKNVPVKVHYDLQDRVTHFRPLKDFTRISVLNTYLVFLTFFYIKPRNLLRKLKKKGLKKFLVEDLFKSTDSPKVKALSVALGVFIGMSPLWGFHTVTVLFLAVAFKLNKWIAFAFSNVSLPPFIPFIVYGGIRIGEWIFGVSASVSWEEMTENFKLLTSLKHYLVGSLVFAAMTSVLAGFGSYLFLIRKMKNNG